MTNNKQQTAQIFDSNYHICIDGSLYNSKTKKYKKWTKDISGYMKTQIWQSGVRINITQHRIMAIYFIDNKLNKTQVNHINGVKHDNRIENLEWVTQSENGKHSFANGLQKVTRPCKKVVDLMSGTIYNSVTDASISLGICRSHLSNMLIGRVKNNTNLVFYGK
jgi:hypothetical protein